MVGHMILDLYFRIVIYSRNLSQKKLTGYIDGLVFISQKESLANVIVCGSVICYGTQIDSTNNQLIPKLAHF